MARSLHKIFQAACCAGVLAAFAPVADAGYTAVNQPKRKSEVTHEQILERVYGGDFVADPTGLSFSNASGVTVTRLEDGTAGESAMSGKDVSARAVAAFAGRRKTAGYFGTSSNGQVHKLFTRAGRQYDVAGAGQTATPVDGSFILGTGAAKGGKVFSSVAEMNRDGMDQLVSYEVKGTAQQASVYLLCWEDKFAGRSDRDYNDLVVEVQAGEAAARAPVSQPLLIPLPPAAWTGLTGLMGLALMSWTRKRPNRRWTLA